MLANYHKTLIFLPLPLALRKYNKIQYKLELCASKTRGITILTFIMDKKALENFGIEQVGMKCAINKKVLVF